MTETAVVECPECGDRKLVEYKGPLIPTVWCNHLQVDGDHEAFIKMKEVEE